MGDLLVTELSLMLQYSAKGEECIPQTWDMFHEKSVARLHHLIHALFTAI